MFEQELNVLNGVKYLQTKIEGLQKERNELKNDIRKYTQDRANYQRQLNGNNFNNNLMNNQNHHLNQHHMHNNIAPFDIHVANMQQINNDIALEINNHDNARLRENIAEKDRLISRANTRIAEIEELVNLAQRQTPEQITADIAKITRLEDLLKEESRLNTLVRDKANQQIKDYGDGNFDDTLYAKIGQHIEKLKNLKIKSSSDITETQINEFINQDRELLNAIDRQGSIINLLKQRHDGYLKEIARAKMSLDTNPKILQEVKQKIQSISDTYKENVMAQMQGASNQNATVSNLESIIALDDNFLSRLRGIQQDPQMQHSIAQLNNSSSTLFPAPKAGNSTNNNNALDKKDPDNNNNRNLYR